MLLDGCPCPEGCAAVSHQSDAAVLPSLGLLGAALKPCDPVVQQLSTCFCGFFRVKLAGSSSVFPDHRCGFVLSKGHSRGLIRGLVGNRCIGMHEVNPGLLLGAGKERAGLLAFQLTPAHVWNPLAGLLWQSLNTSFEQS